MPVDTPEVSDGLRARLESIFDAVEIESESRFRFAELDPVDTNAPIASPVWNGTSKPTGSGLLAASLAPLVYHYAYTKLFKGVAGTAPATLVAHSGGGELQLVDQAFASQLAGANVSRGRWDSKWRIYQAEADGSVHVEKGGTNRLLRPGEYSFSAGVARAPGVGDSVELLVHRDSTTEQAGFYVMFGESVTSDHDDTLLGRFYFHAKPDYMPALIGLLTTGLNRLRVPFRMKCLSNPELYDRSDPAVLYIAKRYISSIMRVLAAHRETIGRMLHGETPLFTKELVTGLGAADEPGGGESFGQSRCVLACKGIVDAWLRGDESLGARMSAVDARFRANGLSLRKPYLNEGAIDQYLWPETESDWR